MQTQERGKVLVIAILGGTGKEGSGLAKRWARAGYQVVIGSRAAERAVERAAELSAELGDATITGMENAAAAAAGDLVVLSVPYDAHRATLESVREQLSGKTLVDLTVALRPPDVRTVHLPAGEAASLEAQALLGDSVRVVAAFQNVSSVKLADPDAMVDCDILVCGDDEAARADVIQLAAAGGMRGLDGGPLRNAIAVEALTPVLLHLNRRYKVKGAGIRITGIE